MRPAEVEHYQNGQVELEVHTFDNGNQSYWIKSGVGFLEFSEEMLTDLIDLLNALDEEVLRPKD